MVYKQFILRVYYRASSYDVFFFWIYSLNKMKQTRLVGAFCPPIGKKKKKFRVGEKNNENSSLLVDYCTVNSEVLCVRMPGTTRYSNESNEFSYLLRVNVRTIIWIPSQ